MAASYIDLAIRRQAMLERIKSGQVRDYLKEIKKIETLIKQTILLLDEDLSGLSFTRLNKLLAGLSKDQAAIYQSATTAFLADSANISALYASQEILDLKKTVDLRGTKLDAFTKKEVFAKVIKRPLTTDGELLEPWIKKFSAKEVTRINGVVRAGHTQGKTNQEIVRQIVGTKSKNFQDGILQTTRRNASTVVRTSVQHVASAARQEVWEANRDVISKYEWLSTLDRSTSSQCQSLDGQKFEFGKGPIPPIHPNCRSTTIPVLDEKFSFLSEGQTRSGEQGPVSADTSYYDWLKGQPEGVQNQVLGKTRAKLFRDGGMTPERFRKLQFDKNFEPLTLKEMQAIEPEAFRKAGIKAKAPSTKTATTIPTQSVTIPQEVPSLIEAIDPGDIAPLNQITDTKKYKRIRSSLETTGWEGRPVVAIERGRGPEALTGSHRIIAAQDAGLDGIPTVIIDAGDVDSDLLDRIFGADDWDKPGFAKEFMPDYAVGLLQAEADLLDLEMGIL